MKYATHLLPIVLLLNSVCDASDIQDSLVGVEGKTLHVAIRASTPLSLETVYGSGICIDPKCSVVTTATHIQIAGRGKLEVTGNNASKMLSLASESNSNKGPVNARAYSMLNDVAFIYTKRPVPHKSGASYSYEYQVGDRVRIAGYYQKHFIVEEAHIIGADALLRVDGAQLPDNIILDVRLKPGQSGSAIVDEQGRLIGMILLSGTVKSNSGDEAAASVGVPVRTIATALRKLDPHLAALVFNTIAEAQERVVQTSVDLNEENDWPGADSAVFPRLKADPRDVKDSVAQLRARAWTSANLFINFTAKQCFVEPNDRSTCHEVSVIEGQQIYRSISKKGKLGKATTTFANTGHQVWNEVEWLDTLREIAESPWVFRGVVNGQYLFSFASSAEDKRCYYEEYSKALVPLFSSGRLAWEGAVECFEQILTDKDFNVLCIFTELRPPQECVTRVFQTVIYFGWVTLEGVTSPILVPTSEEILARAYGEKELRTASVTWTEYRKYRSSHKISM